MRTRKDFSSYFPRIFTQTYISWELTNLVMYECENGHYKSQFSTWKQSTAIEKLKKTDLEYYLCTWQQQ